MKTLLFRTKENKFKVEFSKGDDWWCDSVEIWFFRYWLIIFLK